MRRIEELSMNAWPSLYTMLYDGWIIRFANGYTKRANSVSPLYYSSENIDDKIKKCEELFSNERIRTVFKITDEAYPGDLDSILERLGYQFLDLTSVQLLNLSDIPETTETDIILCKNIDEWLDYFYLVDPSESESRAAHGQILESIMCETYLTCLLSDGKVRACGLGVREDEYIGLFDICVDKDYRRQGFGERLVRGTINIGRNNGARKAYLQVMLDNIPALRLYSKLGFKEAYKYWYRAGK
jgi:Acetyltransferases